MKIGTMLFKTIVVLTLRFLKEVYAVQCTEPALSMCDCSGLEVDCSTRNLAQIPSNIPTDTTSLLLYENNIQSIDNTSLSALTSLENLDFDYNEISSIEAGAFSSLRSLSILTVDNNKLTSIKPDTFKSLGSLRELNLEYNKLTTVSASIFADLTALEYLYLGYNPLICCTMADLIDWSSNQTRLRDFDGDCTDFKTNTDLDAFDVSKCPVDGEWSSWSNSTCSVTCGNGILSRNRTCDSPVPSAGGKTCNGSSVDTSDCSLSDCPVDGHWGSWSTGPCSVTCGNGIRYRQRSCDSPPASNNGQYCIGSSTVSVICTLGVCPESCKESEKKLESKKMKARKWKRYQNRKLNRRTDTNNN
ncbi:slit homolog 1 protein-like isoform X2 [Mytilus californianus]|uniref:slit homolog 1 protein-like isoform X2 n=1 Tax=Mytilus californianus TaxID=6549 RepID=UPI002245E1A1|nr:slit homolog 1 protein-like isoform X2 [Mytilus californianus]